jgi:hypothetical protein
MTSVVDPHQADADPNPDPASHQSYVSANTGPQSLHCSLRVSMAHYEPPWLQGEPLLLYSEPLKRPAFHFHAIRIRVRLFTLMLIRIRILFYADPNPASFLCGSESGFLKGCGSATLQRLDLSWYLRIYKRKIFVSLNWCINLGLRNP